MPRICLLLAWAAAALHAGMIRGTVLENQTSKPLARTQVTLEPVAGTPGGGRSVRTDRAGNFVFPPLSAGAYVLKASRRGFMPMEYGQKQWNSAGVPVSLGPDQALFLTFRLPRYGGITGTIVDENYVGWLEGDVLAYRYAQPRALVARGRSDERGVFRISGLEPGKYLVRSAPTQDEDASYLPTFSKETVSAEESAPVEVYLEQDTGGVEVKPAEGRLFTLSGGVVTNPPGMTSRITLVSDMGRQTTQGVSFRFAGLAPAAYEIYADTLAAPSQGAYTNLGTLDHDSSVTLRTLPTPECQVDVNPSPPGGVSSLQILARRRDLAGVGEPAALRVTDNRTDLGPGRWEVMLIPPSGSYVSGFSGSRVSRDGVSRPDGWNEFIVTYYSSIRFALSSSPGALHGVVKSSGEPVTGAPVYLEAYDPASRNRVTDLRTVRTDMRGLYRFEGLAPGVYRVLSTFEYRLPDVAQMEMAGARSVDIAARGDLAEDLDLYVIR